MEPKNVQKSTWLGRELGGCMGDAGGQHRAYYVGVVAGVTGEDGCGARGEAERLERFHPGRVWLW